MTTPHEDSNSERRIDDELLAHHFGCAEDPEALEEALARDPKLRDRQRRVLVTAGLVEAAARAADPGIDFRALARDEGAARTARRPWSRVAALAAGLLLLLCAWPLLQWGLARQDLREAEKENFQLTVAGPIGSTSASLARFRVETRGAEGALRPTLVKWRALDRKGEVLARGEVASRGLADLSLPNDAAGAARISLEAIDEQIGRREETSFGLGRRFDTPVIHLSLDKPAFRPGETLRMRGVYLGRNDLDPRDIALGLRIRDPRDRVVKNFGRPLAVDGVVADTWSIPAQLPGGEYRLEAMSPDDKLVLAVENFSILNFRAPRLDKQIDLDRRSYARGETGRAEVKVARLDSDAAALPLDLEASVTIDGKSIWQEKRRSFPDREQNFDFQIPEQVGEGRGRFVLTVRDGASVETKVETFFVPDGFHEVRFHPEGGQYVAGQENRLYVEVFDRYGREADVSGKVLDEKNREIAHFQCEHQGRGILLLHPPEGARWTLSLDGPIASLHPLPTPRSHGVVLRSLDASTPAKEALRLRVAVPSEGPWVVALASRGELVAQEIVRGSGVHELDIAPNPEVAGVLRATVYDRELRPVVERLVHRRAARKISVEVELAQRSLSPGASQHVKLRARDETGAPVRAVLGVSVADAALRDYVPEERIGLADRTWFFGDVEELEEVEHFLVDDPDADRNIDLLLGTRGWRSIRWFDPAELVKQEGDRGRRELARLGVPALPLVAHSAREEAPRIALLRAQEIDRAKEARPWGSALLALLAAGVLTFTLARWGGLPRPALATTFGVTMLLALWPATALLPSASPRPATTLRGFTTASAVPQDAANPAHGDEHLIWGKFPEDARSQLFASFGYPITSGLLKDQAGVELQMFFDRGLGPDEAMPDWSRQALARHLRRGVTALPAWGAGPGGQGGPGFGGGVPGGAPGPGGGGGGGGGGGPGGVGFVAGLGNGGTGQAAASPGAGAFFAEWPYSKQRMDAGRRGFIDNDLLRAQLERQSKQRRRGLAARVYAYARPNTPSGKLRHDFQESLFWHPLLITDDEGRAEASFATSDRVTTWNVDIDAHGASRVGQERVQFRTRLPFRLDLRLPSQALEGDQLRIPLRARTAADLAGEVSFEVVSATGIEVMGERRRSVKIAAGEASTLLEVRVLAGFTSASLRVAASYGDWRDEVEDEFEVQGRGFPHREDRSGLLEKRDTFAVAMPDDALEGSLQASLRIFPAATDLLGEGLEGLLQEPGGCFEQTSARNYPNALVLRYRRAVGERDEKLEARATRMLAKGYGRLSGYECNEKGYEWWGSDPAHESLTAYGLLQFEDMRPVFEVENAMVERTRAWLMSRRDGEGGYRLSSAALDKFGRAPSIVTRAYCTYALLVSGVDASELAAELRLLQEEDLEGKDAYRLALATMSMAQAGRLEAARKGRQRLMELQAEDGGFDAEATITMSGGRDRRVEATSFAILAWLKTASFTPTSAELPAAMSRAIAFLVSQRRGSGTFGATQATVMALKALTAHAEANRAPRGRGTITVMVNGLEIARLDYGPKTKGILAVPKLLTSLKPGDNEVEIRSDGDEVFPWTFELSYRSNRPASDADCPLALDLRLPETQIRRGEVVPLEVAIENLSDSGQPMAIARIGLPAGLALMPKILDALKKEQKLDFFEVHNSELVLYWRDLAPRERIAFPIDFEAALAGRSRGLASRVHLYYEPDRTSFVSPLVLEVQD
jgi:A-macroglobulin complement component/alpha-2-macroglobulin family protein/MG2 domain-containing protein